jgi:hypothetical protein
VLEVVGLIKDIKMAIYHMQITPVSRGKGHSATAKIAYNARDRITDLRTGEIHKYNSAKMRADLVHSEITSGKDKIENKHRAEIWNNAELAESRSNSRTAREYVVALPKELTHEQNIQLVREFAQELTLKYGNVADWAIHNEREGNGNIHAHILTTTRKFDLETNRLGAKTDLELDNGSLKKQNKPISQEQIKEIRKDWENLQNRHLEFAGISKSVSCEKQENRDLVKVHLGKEATALERKGIKTELGNHNRIIDEPIYLQAQIFAEEKKLQLEKYELSRLQIQHQDLSSSGGGFTKELEKNYQSGTTELLKESDSLVLTEIQHKNSLTSTNINEEFHPIRKYGFEFRSCFASEDYSYYRNRDNSIEIHDRSVVISGNSEEIISRGIDVAVAKFGNTLEINGDDSFTRSIIETIAKNKDYDSVKLSNEDHNMQLETERFIQRAEILDPDKMLQEEMDKMAQKLIDNAPLMDYEKILKEEERRQKKLEHGNDLSLSKSRGFSR